MKYTYRTGLQKFKIKLINLSTALIVVVTGLSGAAPLLISDTAHADAPVNGVVINEFSANSSPDWVELYNTTDTAVSLNGWKLNDDTSKIADLSGDIAGHGFIKVDVGERLNTDGDTITLIHDQNHQTSVTYGTGSGAIVTAPGDNQSAARVPDGSSTWQVTYTPTPNTSNNPSLTLTNLLPKSGENYADYANGYGFTVDALNVNDKVANDTVTLTVTPDKSGLQNATYSAPGRKGGPGSETFGEAPTINQIMQDTGMQLGDTFTVTASAKDSYGHTATTSSTQVQLGTAPVVAATAVVNTRTNETFDSVQAALADSNTQDGDTIALNADLTTPSFIKITRPIVLDGNGHTITAANTVTSSVFDIWNTTGVTLSDLTVDGNGVYIRGINTYDATVALNNVTLKNNGKDGLVVNGSTVTVSNITTSGNAWDGIDVDKAGAVLTVNGTSKHTEAGNAIYVDNTTTGAKVVDSNNQYTFSHINKHGSQPNDLAYNLKPADTTAPTISFTNPTRFNDTSYNKYFTAGPNLAIKAADASGIKNTLLHVYKADKIAAKYCPVTASDTTTCDTSSFSEGDYYVVAAANDNANNPDYVTKYFSIDKTRPSAHLTAPADGSYNNSGSFTIEGTANDTMSGIDHVNVYVAHNPWSEGGYEVNNQTASFDSSTGTFTYDVSNLPEGTYAVKAVAYDKAGNAQFANTVDLTVDKTAPTGTITYSPATFTNHNVTATLNTSEPIQQSSLPGTWLKKSDTQYQKAFSTNAIQDVTLEDLAGNKGAATVSISWIDKTAPAAFTLTGPSPVDNSFKNTTNFNFTWKPSSDANGVAYKVCRSQTAPVNGVVPCSWGWTVRQSDIDKNGTQFPFNSTFTGNNGNTTWYWQVTATDPAGNSTLSNVGKVTFDTTRPSLSFTAPASFTTPVMAGPTVTVHASDANGLSVLVIHVYDRGTGKLLASPKCTANTAELATGDLSCDLSGLPEGTYYVLAGTNDTAGNNQTIQSADFTVDTTAPTGTFTYSNNNGATVTKDDVTVTLTTSEPIQTPTDWAKGAGNTFTRVYSQNGKYSVDIKDLAGNTCTLKYEVKRIDKVAPVINGVVNGHLYNGAVSYTVTEQSINELLVDGTAVTPVHVSGWGYTGPDVTGDGAHTIKVIDKAGNTASVSFNIDTRAPIATITNPQDGNVLRGTVTVSGTVTDANPDHYYFVVKDATGKVVAGPGVVNEADVADWNWDTTKTADGTYSIDLEARDQAGNKDTSSVATITVTVDNTAPGVTDTFDVTMTTGDKVTLAPTTTDNSNVTYHWNVSDSKLLNDPHDTLDGATLNIGPAPKGSYTATLTVTDQAGNATAVTYNVTVSTPNTFKPDSTGGRGSGLTFKPVSVPKTLGVTTTTSDGVSNVTSAPDSSKPEVKGASTDKPNTADLASDNKSDKDTAKTSNAFLGLGWWWLLVLAVILGLAWFVLGRRSNSTDHNG